MSVILTDEQEQLKKEIVHWYRNYPNGSPIFYYSGAAGTGKTTVAKAVINELGLTNDHYIACAYVGKAVLVLSRSGLPAVTIHSLIYHPTTETVYVVEFDEFGNPHQVKKKKTGFILKHSLSSSLKLIVVDEWGMVNDKMVKELLSFGIPLLVMGDQNQLPPVFGKNSLMDSPDFVLHKIMRQAEGNPIVRLSQMVLADEPIPYGNYGNSRVIDSIKFDEHLLDYDVILTSFNATRDYLNNYIRSDILGYKDMVPVEGDRIICRQNNWDEEVNGICLTNGLAGTIHNISKASLHRGILYADFKPDFMDESFKKLSIDYNYMRSSAKVRKEAKNWITNGKYRKELFEYGYALSVHLSQGSEYPHVLFIEERYRDPVKFRKLRYTAITRAQETITWVKTPDSNHKNFYYNGNYYNLSDTTENMR